MMLGEITVGEEWMLGCSIVVALASIGALVVAIIALNRKQEVKVEQPLEVSFAEKFVPHETFDKHVLHVDRKFEEAHRERADDLRISAISRKSVYDKIGEIGKDATKQTDAVRKELSEKIDNLPGQIVTLLKNTGAI